MEHPDSINETHAGGCEGCPSDFGYLDNPQDFDGDCVINCMQCWDREIPETSEEVKIKEYQKMRPTILDSGNRTEFATGAVRDMREGKGRCDLLPLDVVVEYFTVITGAKKLPAVLSNIDKFQKTGDVGNLYRALEAFVSAHNWKSPYTMLLEVAKHFEEGCKKYGENNWRKGIPVKFYIDSALRHYFKYLRGDKDEPHDRAFCWNILCCIWTIENIKQEDDSDAGEERTSDN